MSLSMGLIRRLTAAGCILGSAVAAAWTPYGQGPYGPDQAPGAAGGGSQAPAGADQGAGRGDGPAPGFSPYGYGAAPPAAADQGSGQGAAPAPGPSPYGYGYPPEYAYPGGGPWGTEGYGPGWGAQPPGLSPFGTGPGFSGMDRPGIGGESGALQITRRATEDAYIIEIGLGGMKPEELQVETQGGWIRIGRDESRQEVREDSIDQGRGYARSWSFSSGRASRRVMLPRDADVTGMTRDESAESVRITIPRRRY